MLILHKLAILTWLVICLTSFAVSVFVPMSYVLNIPNENFQRQKRQISETYYYPPTITSFSVTSNIKYRYATTVVSSQVKNPANYAQTTLFKVTLPDTAFISGFLMQINDNIYEAYVKEKEEAKKDYQEAVGLGETAGHVELRERDSNIFTIYVSLEPQSKVTFNLTYEQLLGRNRNQYEHIINVNPGQVVKSMNIIVNIEEWSKLVVEVPPFITNNKEYYTTRNTKSKIAEIQYPTHKTSIVRWSPSIEQQRQFSDSGARGQLIVRYDVDRNSNPTQILLDDGFFVHFFAQPNAKPFYKHVLFVLDISGSMEGRKIQQLQEALVKILGDIGKYDYFSLVFFSDDVKVWTSDLGVIIANPRAESNGRGIISATAENIRRAKNFVNSLQAYGGTNIIAALRKSIQIAQWGQQHQYSTNTIPLIIFLTDGQPNVEMSDTNEIVKSVTEFNVKKYRLFSLALGEDVDYNFLKKLSFSNLGFAKKIYVDSDTHLQLNDFYEQVSTPLLSNVRFEYASGQIAEDTLTRSKFDNLFDGSEVVGAGKLTHKSAQTVNGKWVGEHSGGIESSRLPSPNIITNEKSKGHLEKMWAYLYINQLLEKYLSSNEQNLTYKQRALELSLKYSFVTPITSLVVRKPNGSSTVNVYKPEPQKGDEFNSSYALSNITAIHWLKNVNYIEFPDLNGTYTVGQSDLNVTESQTCQLPKSNCSATCRHLAHCVIPEIVNSFEDFVPYGEQCIIGERFVGICCRDEYFLKPKNTTILTGSISTPTTVANTTTTS